MVLSTPSRSSAGQRRHLAQHPQTRSGSEPCDEPDRRAVAAINARVRRFLRSQAEMLLASFWRLHSNLRLLRLYF
jgi:hypothetical protein